MAIDTEDKRRSAGSLLWMQHLPVPDGAIGTADRRQVSGLYSGIATDPPAAGVQIDGDATFTLKREDEAARMQSDGSHWWIL